MRSLVEQGKSIIFITHKLKEVLGDRRPHHRAAARPVVGTADPKQADEHSWRR